MVFLSIFLVKFPFFAGQIPIAFRSASSGPGVPAPPHASHPSTRWQPQPAVRVPKGKPFGVGKGRNEITVHQAFIADHIEVMKNLFDSFFHSFRLKRVHPIAALAEPNSRKKQKQINWIRAGNLEANHSTTENGMKIQRC